MLPKYQRIKKTKHIVSVISSRKIINSNYIRLHFKFEPTPGISLRGARLAIVTPKKVGKAHQRNLIRRKLSAVFAEHSLSKLDGFELVIYTKPGVSVVNRQDLGDELRNALNKIRY